MLELFVSYTCPYCRKVMEFFDNHEVDYVKNDVSIEENYNRLVSIGGKDQVPFLFDREKSISIYESEDIIDFVRANV